MHERYSKVIMDPKNVVKIDGIEYTTKPKDGETEGMPKRESIVVSKVENLIYVNAQPLLMP
jgi:hypothetical protein